MGDCQANLTATANEILLSRIHSFCRLCFPPLSQMMSEPPMDGRAEWLTDDIKGILTGANIPERLLTLTCLEGPPDWPLHSDGEPVCDWSDDDVGKLATGVWALTLIERHVQDKGIVMSALR